MQVTVVISLAAGGGQRGRRGRLQSLAKRQQSRVGRAANHCVWCDIWHLRTPNREGGMQRCFGHSFGCLRGATLASAGIPGGSLGLGGRSCDTSIHCPGLGLLAIGGFFIMPTVVVLRLFYGSMISCDAVVLMWFTCPATTVATVMSRAIDRVRERVLGSLCLSITQIPA